MSLKENAKKLNAGGGIPFMEGRTKGDTADIIGKDIKIIDFGFINGDDGEYAVFITEEVNDKFYFGGTIVTTSLKSLVDDLAEVRAEGLPARLVERKSKKNRSYTAIVFYPAENDDLPF